MASTTPLYNMAATSKHKMINNGHHSAGHLTNLQGTIKGRDTML
jgi:hypothetical protein